MPNWDNAQSALHPVGFEAHQLAALWWWMLGGAVTVLALVSIIMLFGMRARGPLRWSGYRMIFSGGIALPIVTLGVLSFFSVDITSHSRSASDPAVTIEVTGKRWWWHVRYLGADGTTIVSANEIRIPTGRPVAFVLRSDNVIHSFWIPRVAGKMDMIPGRVNRLVVQVDEVGIYRGQCAEFCGEQHALMAFALVAAPPEEFQAWLAREAQPAPPPQSAEHQLGQQTFLQSGCGACHTVRGVAGANGQVGPDLTHVGGRLTLGAGTLPNGIGPLAGWIANGQAIKPHNLMPPFRTLDGASLRATAAWLESLE